MGLCMIQNHRVRRFALCFVLTLASGMAAAEDAATNDLVLRNGTIYDGSVRGRLDRMKQELMAG